MSENEMKQMLGAILEAVQMNTAEIQAIKTQLNRMEGRLATVEQDVSILKHDVAVLKQDVAVLKHDVAVLQVEVTHLKETTGRMQGDMSMMQKRMDWIGVNMITKAEFADYVAYSDRTFAKKADLLLSEDPLIRKLNEHDRDIQLLKQRML